MPRIPDQTEAPLIAIDGPSGAGKSTVARQLAQRLGVPYLDTGAMYRAVALIASRVGLEPPFGDHEAERIVAELRRHRLEVDDHDGTTAVRVDGEDVSGSIRSAEVSLAASAVSALTPVRAELVEKQREIGRRRGGVLEGRDIGSVVFPDAVLKVFLTASAEERARRRFEELQRNGAGTTLDEVRRDQRRRDVQDTSRADSPLQVAQGAVVIDSTDLKIDEVVDRLVDAVRERLGEALDSHGQDAVRSRNHGS